MIEKYKKTTKTRKNNKKAISESLEKGNNTFSNSMLEEIINNSPTDNKYGLNPELSLFDSIKGTKKNNDEKMESYKEQYSYIKSNADKLYEMELDTGKVEVGVDENNKTIIGISKKTGLNQTNSLESEKTIANNRAAFKYKNTDKILYDGSNEEAVAIELNSNKNSKKISSNLRGIVEKDKKITNTIDTTLPFLNKEESREKIELLKALKKDNNQVSLRIEKEITHENNLLVRKSSKELDFNKKLNKAITSAKERKNRLLDDLPIIIKKKYLEEEDIKIIVNENKEEDEQKAGE